MPQRLPPRRLPMGTVKRESNGLKPSTPLTALMSHRMAFAATCLQTQTPTSHSTCRPCSCWRTAWMTRRVWPWRPIRRWHDLQKSRCRLFDGRRLVHGPLLVSLPRSHCWGWVGGSRSDNGRDDASNLQGKVTDQTQALSHQSETLQRLADEREKASTGSGPAREMNAELRVRAEQGQTGAGVDDGDGELHHASVCHSSDNASSRHTANDRAQYFDANLQVSPVWMGHADPSTHPSDKLSASKTNRSTYITNSSEVSIQNKKVAYAEVRQIWLLSSDSSKGRHSDTNVRR